MLTILGRSLVSASKFDPSIRNELSTWPDGFTILYRVLNKGPNLILKSNKAQFIVVKTLELDAPNITVYIKNIEFAYLITTCQIGTIDAFIQRRAVLKGDIPIGMSLIRCINIIQTYLFPRWFARRVVKRLPSIPWYKRYMGRARLYLLGIPFGI